MNPSTFIILVNYNNHYDTLKCLESIELAGYGEMVVVVDNNSTLPGVNEIKARYPKAILIKNDENIGFGGANNIGIDWALKNTNCEYVFILNNDTTINKNTISILEEALSGNENVAIAAPKIVMMDDPDLLWYGGGEIDWKKGSVNLPGYLESSMSKIACKSRFIQFASGCAMLIRCSTLYIIGGFDTRFFMYEEDLEICCRVLEKKMRILYVPSAVVQHKGQGSTREENDEFRKIWSPSNPNLPFYMFQITRNRLLCMYLHAKGFDRIKFFTLFPAILLIKGVQFVYHRRTDGVKAMFHGFFDFFKLNKGKDYGLKRFN